MSDTTKVGTATTEDRSCIDESKSSVFEKETHLPDFYRIAKIDLESVAFVLRYTGEKSGVLLNRNPKSTKTGFEEPAYVPQSTRDDTPNQSFQIDEDTSGRRSQSVDEEPSAWLFPDWNWEEPVYTFGFSSKHADILFPRVKGVSSRHFALYVNGDGNWMIKSFSRFGTIVNEWVLGQQVGGEIFTDVALDPRGPNFITVGVDQHFRCVIYTIPHLAPTPDKNVRIQSRLEKLESESGGSTISSLSAPPRVLFLPPKINQENYFFLEDRKVQLHNEEEDDSEFTSRAQSDIFMAIRKRDGRNCVVKRYQYGPEENAGEGRRQARLMLRLTEPPNIVAYLAGISFQNDFRIITPYIDGLFLAHFLEMRGSKRKIELSFVVFKDISSALSFLEKEGLVHNDINEHTIIVKHRPAPFVAFLTGFSEVTKVDKPKLFRTGFLRDVMSLGAQVERALPVTDEGQSCCDPEFRSILIQASSSRTPASIIERKLDCMAQGYREPPWVAMTISKQMTVNRYVDQNGTEAVRLLDFLRIVLHLSPQNIKDTDIWIQKVLHPEKFVLLDGEPYCLLEEAEKLFYHKPELIIPNFEPPSLRKASWYDTKHRVEFEITYHKPSRMVNITQILNLFDHNVLEEYLGNLTPVVQEIRGAPSLEGYYIDPTTFEIIVKLLGLHVNSKKLEDLKREPFEPIFLDQDNDWIAIATHEMIDLILVNRDGRTVQWNDKIMTIETAINVCDEHGLVLARRKLLQVNGASEPNWTAFKNDEEIIQLFEGDSRPTSITSHASFYDGDEDKALGFRFKKMRSNIPMPILPRRLPSTSPRVLPAEKCREWFDKVEKGDMVRTKFAPTSSPASASASAAAANGKWKGKRMR
ncbi:hypothetical protein G7Y89_g3298 [Cudoniella acicularis]|uniref:Protein kinase domain-containing protein n=1 Tax=Cudoniella acicularis TaxID=354080 RepID=A0A8H4RRN0_9HELO|nr:hypothetical protein G7Y89_g3298 [Cudoniella acicularis]